MRPTTDLVGLRLEADDRRKRLAGRIEPRRADAGLERPDIAPRLEGHDDLFHRRVPGALANAIEGAFHLPRPRRYAREAIGRRQSQVVVAVNADDGVRALQHLHHRLDHVTEFVGHGVSDCVRYVHGPRTRIDGGPRDLAQEIQLGAAAVLRAERHVVHEGSRQAHGLHGLVEDLRFRHAELVLAMDGTGGDEGVDPRPFGRFHRAGGAFDIKLHCCPVRCRALAVV